MNLEDKSMIFTLMAGRIYSNLDFERNCKIMPNGIYPLIIMIFLSLNLKDLYSAHRPTIIPARNCVFTKDWQQIMLRFLGKSDKIKAKSAVRRMLP